MPSCFYDTYFIFLTNLKMQMRKILSKKLKSNEGASLMVALLFFVICAALGSIVLTAATSASGRLTGIKKNNKDMYILKSAANMFKDGWEGVDIYLYKDSGDVVMIKTETTDFNDLINIRNELAKNIYRTGETVPTETLINLSLSGVEDVSDVVGKVTMDAGYNITVSFSIKNPSATNGSTVVLSYKSITGTITDSGVEKRKVGWTDPHIYVGDIK